MANSTKKKYSIYILGAGFSCPAGLPQANGLWPEIRRRAQATDGRAKRHFDDDLRDYIAYKSACDGEKLSPEEIAFEDFMAYLDVEHYLRLRGSDTFSSNGNETQILVKTLIGKILTERTPQKESIPLLYLEFARLLKPRDIVITFNYDVLLERALEVVGVEYRLFPSRYEGVYPYGATVDYSREEVIVLKMHGSIDWFTEQLDEPSVFSRIQKFGITPLTDGPRRELDPLLKICRVTDIDSLYKNIPLFLAVPTLLNPSPQKLVYSSVFHDFWNGLALDGGPNFGMAIIDSPCHLTTSIFGK